MSGGLITWFDQGQNRESGGRDSERTGYATGYGGESSEATGSGPAA